MKYIKKFESFNINEQYDSKEEFLSFMEILTNEYPNEEWSFILSTLQNDEESSDLEIKDYLISNGVDDILTDKLISKRQYFFNFDYTKDLTI
jgi:hypothetical protein